MAAALVTPHGSAGALVGPVGASARPSRIAYEACPLCGGLDAEEVRVASAESHPLYAPELPATMRWIRCDGCNHVFVDGYLDEAALAVLFRSAHPSQVPGPETVRGREVAAEIVGHVSRSRGAWEGRWLDVGFGCGALMAAAAELSYDVVGIDLRSESVEQMRQRGFDARCTDLGGLRDAIASGGDGPGRFDVVSMADVLEHTAFPKEVLAQAHELLAPGGALFLSMPNLDSFAWKELDREGRNPYWGELEHCHNFGRARLVALLRDLGLSPVHYGISKRYLACMEIVALKPRG